MNRKKSIITAFAIIILILVAGCNRKNGTASKDSGKKAAKEVTIFAVSTTRAVKGEIKDYLQLNGDVTARTTVDTFAETTGKLKNIYVKVGDSVRKNQVIADVDPSRPGMTFVASPVKASISGTVTLLPVQIGSVIVPNLPVAKISKMDELQVILYVAERFISKIKVGLPAIITTEAYPGEIFSGRIRELSPVVDPVSRTMEVKLSVQDKKSKLKAGMFAEVKLITEVKENIVKIPAEALISRFGETYVFMLGPGTTSSGGQIAKKVPVTPGLRIDNQLEIIAGLSGGNEIVVQGQSLLEDGSHVKIVSTVPPLASTDTLK